MRSLVAASLLALTHGDETSLMQDLVKRSASSKLSVDLSVKESRPDSTARLLETATKMVKNGVTPDVVQFVDATLEEIDTDVLPAILNEHSTDQTYINDICASLTDAVNELVAAKEEILQTNQIREAASRDHQVCRQQEAVICARHRRCEEQLRTLWIGVKIAEEQMREIHNQIHDEWCVHPPTNPSIEFCANQPAYPNELPSSPHALNHCFNWEAQSPYPLLNSDQDVVAFRHLSVSHFDTYIEKKEAVEVAWAAYNIKVGHCGDLETDLSLVDKTEECDQKQEEMRGQACTHSAQNRAARERFGQRWDQLTRDYDMAKLEKDVLQMDRIAEWETLHIVKCLLTHVHSAVQDNLDTGAPCPTIESDPDGVNRTIEDCHIVTRGCPWAWDHPNDRESLNGAPLPWPVIDCPAEDRVYESPVYGAMTVGIYSCSMTAHLCLDWCEKPQRPELPPPLPRACTPAYVAREQGSFHSDIQAHHEANLLDQLHYAAWGASGAELSDLDPIDTSDPLTAHLTGLDSYGWAGCAPPLVCEDCPAEPALVDHDNVEPARVCLLHEAWLAPGHSDLDTFRCHDGYCVSMSGRCNGHSQCADGSDELGCGGVSTDVGVATDCADGFNNNDHDAGSCGSVFNPDVHFECNNGKYVDRAALCNNYDNCGDGTDEDQCTGSLGLRVEATSGRTISVETLSHHTLAFHDRQYTFDSLGSFAGKTLIKYSNDDKWTDDKHVMTKIRTNAPTTVYIVRAAGTAPWAVGHGFTQDHSLTGVSFKGQRAINRAGPASEWQDTRHKEWDPSKNTEDEIPLTEVWTKSFPAGTISIPGNNGGDGSFLIFVDRPSATGLWGRHREELGELKCNNNVDMVYVANQAECEDLAIAAGHPFYSFRHNGESAGHKCMSSAHCDSPLDDRTNDWAVYVSPDHNPEPECQVLYNQDVVAGTFAHYGADRMGAASSDAECSALCTASTECTAWVRQPSSGNCWLTRQSQPVFEADTDRNTGLRCDQVD